MRFTFSVMNHVLKAGVLVAALAFGTGIAKADPMTFTGTTTGVFTGTGTNTLQTLTYNNGSFNGMTSANGYVGFGGTVATGGNFGTFTLGGNSVYSNNPFRLTITFSNPLGIAGGQSSTYNATVFGSVSSTSNGGATVTFSPSSQMYSFSNSQQTGTFTLNLNNASLNAGQSTFVTGNIVSSATSVTPEPNSLMLLGTGFVSAAGMLMRRRKMMTA